MPTNHLRCRLYVHPPKWSTGHCSKWNICFPYTKAEPPIVRLDTLDVLWLTICVVEGRYGFPAEERFGTTTEIVEDLGWGEGVESGFMHCHWHHWHGHLHVSLLEWHGFLLREVERVWVRGKHRHGFELVHGHMV